MLHWVFHAPAESEPLPPVAEWLSEAERARALGFRFERRRGDWLRGRRAAKEATAAVIRERWGEPPPHAHLYVDAEPGGAPFVRLALEAPPCFGFDPGQRLPIAISISHRAGAVFCAAAGADEVADRLGADLELVERRAPSFAGDFFCAEEIAACAGSREDRLVSAVWCAKEAVLKALRLGLAVDTRSVACLPEDTPAHAPGLEPAAGWRMFRLLRAPGGASESALSGLWRAHGPFVQALACGGWPAQAQGAA
jgi:4'-phosphopantetheinyl transferase